MTRTVKAVRRFATLGVALALCATAAPAGVATAAEGSATGPAAFAAQVREAGLAPAAARELQSKVDGYLAVFGGTQVSANKIEIPDVGSIVVAVPGQTHAVDLVSPQDMYIEWPWYLCDYYHFCMFRGMAYTGDKLSLYHCNEVALSNWVGWGSYINRQTSGTQTVMYDRAHRWYVGSIAPHTNAQFNWDPVWYVDPC